MKVYDISGMEVDFVDANNHEDGKGIAIIPEIDDSTRLFVDIRNGKAWPIPLQYQHTPMYLHHSCGGYSCGLIMVSAIAPVELAYHHEFEDCAGMWGWLDESMSEVIEPQFIFAQNFENDKAIVARGEWVETDDGLWCKDERWGIIDLEGKEVVPCVYDEIYRIKDTDDFFIVHKGNCKDGGGKYSIYELGSGNEYIIQDDELRIGGATSELYMTKTKVILIKGYNKKDFIVFDLNSREFK